MESIASFERGRISVQVLSECFVNLVRKGVPIRQATDLVTDYSEWNVIPHDTSLLLEGIEASRRWKISLWDALILRAAKRSKEAILWSEDLNAGQSYDGVRVINSLGE